MKEQGEVFLRSCTYHCVVCDSVRRFQLNTKQHLHKVENSGLVVYSDIHLCGKGLLGINNLHIDHNFDVRSFSLLELPNRRVEPKLTKSATMGMPSPSTKEPINQYVITSLYPDKEGYRIIIKDKSLNVLINIGKVIKMEEPIFSIKSEKGDVELEYYKSALPLRGINKNWFKELVNSIEDLPPTKLGLFLETLRFLQSHHNSEPSEFEILQLRTILSTHKTSFKVIYSGLRYKMEKTIAAKYGNENKQLVKDILDRLEEDPETTLQELNAQFKQGLVHLIYLLLILENERVIEIKRDIEITN